MKKYRSSSIRSKWLKTHWLLKHHHLRKYIPQTMHFNKDNLIKMLSTYSTVYFKPTGGSGGFNIIRITRKPKGYQTQYNTATTSFLSTDQLYKYLSRFSNNRSFLLQKGIHLARTNGKPFDIRVMVQKTSNGTWVSTALFTKIGKPGKVATNYNQGGKIGFFQPTLAGAGYNNERIQHSQANLKRLGVTVGEKLDLHMKGFRELGLDVALDSEGKPWILEVNTRPQFYPLRNMNDKKLYRRILTYAKQYGRYK